MAPAEGVLHLADAVGDAPHGSLGERDRHQVVEVSVVRAVREMLRVQQDAVLVEEVTQPGEELAVERAGTTDRQRQPVIHERVARLELAQAPAVCAATPIQFSGATRRSRRPAGRCAPPARGAWCGAGRGRRRAGGRDLSSSSSADQLAQRFEVGGLVRRTPRPLAEPQASPSFSSMRCSASCTSPRRRDRSRWSPAMPAAGRWPPVRGSRGAGRGAGTDSIGRIRRVVTAQRLCIGFEQCVVLGMLLDDGHQLVLQRLERQPGGVLAPGLEVVAAQSAAVLVVEERHGVSACAGWTGRDPSRASCRGIRRGRRSGRSGRPAREPCTRSGRAGSASGARPAGTRAGLLQQLVLDRPHGLAGRESSAVRDTEDVSIHRHGRLAERGVQDDVRRLASDARQRLKALALGGNLTPCCSSRIGKWR